MRVVHGLDLIISMFSASDTKLGNLIETQISEIWMN